MGVLSKLADFLGSDDGVNRFECQDCGTTFESHLGTDDPVLTCAECNSREFELVREG